MLTSGTKLGRYEIRSKLGEGGMGEYRAYDPSVHREVAIKVLPAALSADKDRLARFEQEAQAAGALNHPNILVIHHIETHEGAPYIVSELLEGETLRERMGGAALPQRKAIDYALQVAHGLAAAHEKGIVHRDLKPENIFVTKDGRVKILDFGIAKLTGAVDGNQPQTSIPTRRVNTDPGQVIGTVGYMSPEQVTGRAVDHRSDIFSFGAILYEMLSGRRAFHGESAAETLSAILKEDPPDLSQTNQRISPALERVVNHCLEKNPEERFHSAGDLAFALDALSGSTPISTQTIAMPASFRPRKLNQLLPWIIVGILALGLLIMLPFALSSFRRAPERANAVRATILPPPNMTFPSFATFAVSPDGLRLVFSAPGANGREVLWVRPLNALTAQSLAGTEEGSLPFWAPDSRFIGFFAQGKLKKIDTSGGPPQTICDAPNPRGGTWNRDGIIVFSALALNNPAAVVGTLYRVSASGGAATLTTSLDKSIGQTTHRWPWFLPDDHHFLYTALVSPSQNVNNSIYLGSLDSNEQRLILRGFTNVVYSSGHLLFMREGSLMAQRFDEKTFQLIGDAFPIAERVDFFAGTIRGSFSASENGVLIFQSGSEGRDELNWFDRGGKQIGRVGQPGFYREARLSPSGDKLAAASLNNQSGGLDIWLYELARNVPTRFTFGPGFAAAPLWSADGSQIVFNSNQKGRFDIYQKAANGTGNEELLFQSDETKTPTSWSADGRFIAFTNTDTKTNTKDDLWILPLFGDRKPYPFLQTPFNEIDAQFSPDGHWIAYVSDESGTNQVYLAPFPGPGGKREVSRDGGTEPRWRADGKELFFVAADKKLMAVEVDAKGDTLEIGNAQPLFDTRLTTAPGTHYDVTGDGKRFLFQMEGEGGSPPLTLVVNWTADLKS
jgi:serine/threonine protein kinase